MLAKIEIFGQKSKFWSKIEVLVKNSNLVKKSNFGQKLKFWSNKTWKNTF